MTLAAAVAALAAAILPVGASASASNVEWIPSARLRQPSIPQVAIGTTPSGAEVAYGADSYGIWRRSPASAAGARWLHATIGGGAPLNVFGIAAGQERRAGAVVSTSAGVFRSVNGGRTWAPTPAQPATQVGPIAMSRGGSVVAVAGSDHGYAGRLSVSRDAGRHWTKAAPFPVRQQALLQIGAVAIAQGSRPWIAVAAFRQGYGGFQGTFQSKDFGRTWTATRAGARVSGSSPASGPMQWTMAFSPRSPRQLVLAPGIGARANAAWIWRSEDFGASWRRARKGVSVAPGGTSTSGVVLALDSVRGGDPLSTSSNGGRTWRSIAGGTGGILPGSIAGSPSGRVIAVAAALYGNPKVRGIAIGLLK